MEGKKEIIKGILTLKPECKKDEETWTFTWVGQNCLNMTQNLSFSWETMEKALDYLKNSLKVEEFEKIKLTREMI
tara:strand:- start:619 stop:843 length:225 start_codon:yes stop_codon:yes gene_type:complete